MPHHTVSRSVTSQTLAKCISIPRIPTVYHIEIWEAELLQSKTGGDGAEDGGLMKVSSFREHVTEGTKEGISRARGIHDSGGMLTVVRREPPTAL
jgi:hypothetical protein